MYATINLHGSSHFDYHGPATKEECAAWLDKKKAEYQDSFGGNWVGAYMPATIITNRTAERMKYRDGTRVIRRPEEY